ncbi:MAG: FkbM family methyltransferase [Rickettsiales bacterium]|jgi:FkbM family methyltransferase|nr:FkbM family methyltransferase [Rickettsiales bacterium]
MRVIDAVLKFLYQPFKFIGKSFGYKLVAIRLSDLPLKYDINISYNKDDPDIISKLPDAIILENKLKNTEITSDNFDFIINFTSYSDKISKVYQMLSDDLSKQVYFEIIKSRLISSFNEINLHISPSYTFDSPKYPIPVIDGDRYGIKGILRNTYLNSQYEIPDIFEVKPGDIIFDIGAYYGDTALFFDSAVSPNGKVYAFEPNSNIAAVLKSNISKNKRTNIIVVEKGLSDTNSKSSLFNKEGASHIVSVAQSEYLAGSSSPTDQILDIELTTIDDYIHLENIKKIDLIKMDIEGHETAAINGAKQTLISRKPKLAVAIYHSAHDLFELPLLIHRIQPEYKLYVRHATTELSETVLFCI